MHDVTGGRAVGGVIACEGSVDPRALGHYAPSGGEEVGVGQGQGKVHVGAVVEHQDI